MDNQVAINFLDQVRKILLDDKSWLESTKQPINEAFDMAISALEEQDISDINVGDMISRQLVIDELKRYFHDEYYQRTSIQDCINCFIEDILTKLPSAQSEIIRCKDCKYCDRGIDEDGNPFLKCLGWAYGGTQEDDFCSHAERRRQ